MNCGIVNSFRLRINKWIMHTAEGPCHKVYGERKQQMFENLPDSFVELGPGTGSNFRYYRQGTLLTAVEPNPKMHGRLRKNAAKYGINLDILQSKAEHLDLPDESTDVVVTTLMLCSVDHTLALNEVHRILRPGGRLLFIEHIASPKGSLLRLCQDLMRRPWKWCFEGCDLTCHTDTALTAAAFSKLELEHFKLKGLFAFPTKHQIAGIATK